MRKELLSKQSPAQITPPNLVIRAAKSHVTESKYNAHTEPLLIKENMLKLEDLFKLQCVKLMHKKCH